MATEAIIPPDQSVLGVSLKNRPVDPYALWALGTDFRGFKQCVGGRAVSSSVLTFVAEVDQPTMVNRIAGRFVVKPNDLEGRDAAEYASRLISAYRKSVSGASPFSLSNLSPFSSRIAGLEAANTPMGTLVGGSIGGVSYAIQLHVPDGFDEQSAYGPSRFVTMQLTWVGADPSQRSLAVRSLMNETRPLKFIMNDPEKGETELSIIRMQIGDPRGFDNQSPPMYGVRPSRISDRAREADAVILGVVEDTAPFAHLAFQARNGHSVGTRFIALWDQTSTRRPRRRWAHVHGFFQGRQIDQLAMNDALSKHCKNGAIDEGAVYADLDVGAPELLQRASHGAAVLTLLAGSGAGMPPLPRLQSHDIKNRSPRLSTEDDAAGKAPIIAVQLPREQTTVSSSRWLSINALEGLRYIMECARQQAIPGKAPPPLVVNMSYGAMAGPHDGTGLLECGIQDLVDTYGRASVGTVSSEPVPGNDMAVVLAAGNAGGMLRDDDSPLRRRLPGGMHARAALTTGRQTRRFTLFVPPDKAMETYVEFWFPSSQDGRLDLSGIQLVVTPPGGAAWPGVRLNAAHFWPSEHQNHAGILFCGNVPQAKNRSMALLVLAPTRIDSAVIDDPFVAVPAGRWTIDIVRDAPETELVVDAWVERDDSHVGFGQPQRARFVDMGNDPVHAELTDSNIFTNVAMGGATFTAGALQAGLDATSPGAVPAYSAAGIENRGPDFSAITDICTTQPGIPVSGSQSGQVLRVNGTSMAAPQAARWIANRLAAGADLRTIRAELAGSSQGDDRRGRIDVLWPGGS